VHVVHHGLGSDFADLVRASAPARQRAAGDTLRVVGVGRLVPKKGFDTFVRACGVLRDTGVAVSADIVGESGEHEPVVRALVAELGLSEQVRVLGTRSPSQLHRLYQQADVVSLACRVTDNGDRDGIPNVLVEAMACGTPVVSTTVSGIPELVRDGENGLLVRPDDEVALAAAWRRLGDKPALARRLGAAGRETVARDFDGSGVAQLAALFTADSSAQPIPVGVSP
jgi:glycosyltransferase involved in cell wall biosynthesis